MIFTTRFWENHHGPSDLRGPAMNRVRDWYKSLFETLHFLNDKQKYAHSSPESTSTPPPPGLRTSDPDSAFQNFTRLSADPVTTRVPSGEKATDQMAAECPVKVHTCHTSSSQTQTLRKRIRKKRKPLQKISQNTSPPPLITRNATAHGADLCSCLGVPDRCEVVTGPDENALSIRGERDRDLEGRVSGLQARRVPRCASTWALHADAVVLAVCGPRRPHLPKCLHSALLTPRIQGLLESKDTHCP